MLWPINLVVIEIKKVSHKIISHSVFLTQPLYIGYGMVLLKSRYRSLVGMWIGIALGTIIYYSRGKITEGNIFTAEGNYFGPGLLDGCYHVYLDVGSNVGIQGKSSILSSILILFTNPNYL